MNPLTPDTWNRGLLYKDYRRTVRRNGKVFDEVYREPAYHPEDLDFLRQLPPLRVLAIGEDWWPDVYHTVPTWVRIAGFDVAARGIGVKRFGGGVGAGMCGSGVDWRGGGVGVGRCGTGVGGR